MLQSQSNVYFIYCEIKAIRNENKAQINKLEGYVGIVCYWNTHDRDIWRMR